MQEHNWKFIFLNSHCYLFFFFFLILSWLFFLIEFLTNDDIVQTPVLGYCLDSSNHMIFTCFDNLSFSCLVSEWQWPLRNSANEVKNKPFTLWECPVLAGQMCPFWGKISLAQWNPVKCSSLMLHIFLTRLYKGKNHRPSALWSYKIRQKMIENWIIRILNMKFLLSKYYIWMKHSFPL